LIDLALALGVLGFTTRVAAALPVRCLIVQLKDAPASYAVPARSAYILDNADLRDAAALGPDRPGQAVSVPEPSSGGGGSIRPGALLALLAAALLAAALLLKVLPRRV